MRMNNCMIPLGGADEIGASAYFVSLDGVNILLDCGARLSGVEKFPDYSRLLQEIPDYTDLDLILISHGHYDHIGSFASIASLAPNAEIITTQDTKHLIELQLLDFGRISGKRESDKLCNERYRVAQGLLSRIQVQSVMHPFNRKGCKITFYSAGHMIGAVMIHLETAHNSLLYTGDFHTTGAFDFNRLQLPEDLHPDILLLNAPNVYQDREKWEKQLRLRKVQGTAWKGYSSNPDPMQNAHLYENLQTSMDALLAEGKRIYLVSRSIPKHLDLFHFLKAQYPSLDIGLEEKSKVIADALSEMGYPVYRRMLHVSMQSGNVFPVVVGQESRRPGYTTLQFDQYTLHASPVDTLELVQKLAPKQTYLLHVQPDQEKVSLQEMLAAEGFPYEVTQAVNGAKTHLRKEKP